ncbi:hypothetical protein EB796_004264 [Bugula neritina]|uniref:Uncharacterized protein n=1 Tax=Bugula neritina TaxID=10212 RepID=A0A7J7KFL4_BUGNE|nr:hypothetical protein EB796_004264 [Bugula neritina]
MFVMSAPGNWAIKSFLQRHSSNCNPTARSRPPPSDRPSAWRCPCKLGHSEKWAQAHSQRVPLHRKWCETVLYRTQSGRGDPKFNKIWSCYLQDYIQKAWSAPATDVNLQNMRAAARTQHSVWYVVAQTTPSPAVPSPTATNWL